jgi:hypothetical protein
MCSLVGGDLGTWENDQARGSFRGRFLEVSKARDSVVVGDADRVKPSRCCRLDEVRTGDA